MKTFLAARVYTRVEATTIAALTMIEEEGRIGE
jgi:hypothetical protein